MPTKLYIRQLAIPVKDNILSERLSECNTCIIYKAGKASTLKRLVFRGTNAENLVKWAVESGITDLVVHNIEPETANLFSTTKINLFIGLPIVQPELLIEAFLNGTLKSNPNFIKS